jgi:hypothetical protein
MQQTSPFTKKATHANLNSNSSLGLKNEVNRQHLNATQLIMEERTDNDSEG